jgi:hypothetical protein
MAFPRRVFLQATALGLAPGCGLIGFDVKQMVPPQTVQGSPLGALLPGGLFQIPLNIDLAAQTKAMGTGPASSAHLKTLSLAVTSPAGETFEFLDELSVSVSGQGLETKLVARSSPVPAESRISLEVFPGVDLLPYISRGATLVAAAQGHMPTRTVTFDGEVVIRVEVA